MTDTDRRMIDLRGYLWKLRSDSTGWAAPGDHRRPVMNTRAASGLTRPQGRGVDAVLVRARLGNYQRALTSARKALPNSHPALAFHQAGASLFITNSDGGADHGSSAERGGDQ